MTIARDQLSPRANSDLSELPQQEWDLLVVGGGTAGIVGAKTAAGFGARVILVERERTGGDCLWTGCVPSKSLLAAAAAAADARAATRFGVHTGTVRVDFDGVMGHVRSAIAAIAPADSAEALEAAGVYVVTGNLTFTGTHTADIAVADDDGSTNSLSVVFAQALVATGAAPALLPIEGLAASGALTTDTVWDLTSLPARLVVLGGGSIGCELGQAFARLGSQVTIVEGADRILPREDAAASAVVAAALTIEAVRVLTGVRVVAVEAVTSPGSGGRLKLHDGSHVDYDELLVAVGRSPRTEGMGLSAAGVEVDKGGFVVVDKHLRTTNHHIWAAGDLTGHPQFTHTAGVHGSLAASNAVLGLRRNVDTSTTPRVTFTHPEVAAVGVSTDEARTRADLTLLEWGHEHLDRAVIEGSTGGFARLVVDGKGRVLGATVVGPRAGETLGELTLAIKHGLRTRDLAGTTHAYPTYSDGPWNAAIADVRTRLNRPGTARAIRMLAALRRRRVGGRR
ncbi:MAG: FAD-dependent oxidoreductase [Dermatophilaceae bacterium]